MSDLNNDSFFARNAAQKKSNTASGVVTRHNAEVSPLQAPQSNQCFGKYAVIAELGKGGMGKVCKGYDPNLNRTVAIKTLLDQEHISAEQMERFLREAKVLAQLSHPNIVQIFEIGQEQQVLFYAMEYVEGRTLQSLIRQKKTMTAQEALPLMLIIGKAVSYLHSQGVLHRDLKPGNIMINDDGVLKVMDFGLAKVAITEQKLSQEGQMLGTVGYMAPEQYDGISQNIDQRSDVYALGVILYEMLTGSLPFIGDSAINVLAKQMDSVAQRPSLLQKAIAKDLDTICLKAIDKDKKYRYQSVQEFCEDMQRFLAYEPILARPIGIPEKLWRKITRNPKTSIAVAALALAGIAIPLYFYYSKDIAQEVQNTRPLLLHDNREMIEAGIKQLTTLFDHPRQNPQTRAQTLFWRAQGYERLRQYNGAANDYREALKLGLELADAKFAGEHRSVCGEYARNIQEVMADLQKQAIRDVEIITYLLGKPPHFLGHPQLTPAIQAQLLLWRALERERQKDYTLARQDYQVVCNLSLKNTEPLAKAQERLPVCEDYAQDDLAALVQEVEKELASQQPAVWQKELVRLGHLLAHPCQNKESGAEIMGKTLFLYALAHEKLKKYEEARQHYVKSLELPWSQTALAKIREGICAYYGKDYAWAKKRFAPLLASSHGLSKAVTLEVFDILLEMAFSENNSAAITNYWGKLVRDFSKQELKPLTMKLFAFALDSIKSDAAQARKYFAIAGDNLPAECSYVKEVCEFYKTCFQQGKQIEKKWIERWEAVRQNQEEYRPQAHIFLAYLYWKSGPAGEARNALKKAARGKPLDLSQYPECAVLLSEQEFQSFVKQP
jgi:serine/threonine protein kinase